LDALLLKLLITPLLISAASLAGRRWGSTVSGWLLGLPFTSAPIVFFVALDQGTSFAATTSISVLAGTVAVIAFAATYAVIAFRGTYTWPVCLSIGYVAFILVTLVFQYIFLPALQVFALLIIILICVLVVFPVAPKDDGTSKYPWWDLPARIIAATAFVILITDVAPNLGPHLSGLVTPFPVYTSILAVFNQSTRGVPSVLNLLRGLLYGLFSFAAFFLIVSTLLSELGLEVTFALALVVALGVQGVALRLLRKE
jgi:hypothetical protein